MKGVRHIDTMKWGDDHAKVSGIPGDACSERPDPESFDLIRTASLESAAMVHDFLIKSARDNANKIALVQGTEKYTYSEVLAGSYQVARFLQSVGVNQGDRIGILLNNSFEYVVSYYGSLIAGATTVPMNTGITPDGMADIVTTSDAKILFTEKRYHGHLKRLRDVFVVSKDALNGEPGAKTIRFDEIYSGFADCEVDVPNDPECFASIIFTSGSTGKPKGVILTHRNIVANTRSIVEYLSLSCNDRIMVVLPFFYVYGKSLLNTHFSVGGTVIIDNRFLFPNAILETMVREDATGFAGVPSTFMILLDKSSIRSFQFSTLRYVTQAGGAMSPAVIKRVAEVFADKQVFIMYGATEASARLTYLDPARLYEQLGSVGKAIPGVQVDIRRVDGRSAAPGEIGEIVAYGENIMKGYWKDPEATDRALSGGGYHTGDLAFMNSEGFIYLVGRKDDIMKIGGYRVSAKSIEDVLYEMPEIHEAAVVGVADEVLGQAPHAFIVLMDGCSLSADQVTEYCLSRLTSYEVPRRVSFIKDLPKNSSGKIMKNLLKSEE